MTPEPFHQPMLPIFIPWCAGTSRHGRLVRKHVPDSDPGSIPAPAGDTNYRRPNNDSPGSQVRCSAGACPPLGSGWGVAESAAPIRCTKPQLRLFIPSCAGASQHERLVRKHVPDSDPGSIPAPAGDTNHRRPNNDSPGSQARCSAGACPPLGSGWGVAESAVPIRCTKPQLRLFIPSCAGASQHERLVRKHVPDSDPGWMFAVTFVGLGRPGEARHPRHPPRHSRESGNLGEVWVVAMKLDLSHQPMLPIFIPWCAGDQPACAIGTKACPGLRSGINSGTGRRHQPPSPEQRQPRVAREM